MTNVLFVDDNESQRMIMGEILESLGFIPILASTVDEAKDKFQGPIDLLITDWNLDPNERSDGPHAEELCHIAFKNGIPVLVRTGTDDTTGRLQKLGEGCTDDQFRVLSKELSVAELRTSILGSRRKE